MKYVIEGGKRLKGEIKISGSKNAVMPILSAALLIKGKTVIAIAHRLSTIENADKIAVIEEGKIIEQGKFKELLKKKGKFYNYWKIQTEIKK